MVYDNAFAGDIVQTYDLFVRKWIQHNRRQSLPSQMSFMIEIVANINALNTVPMWRCVAKSILLLLSNTSVFTIPEKKELRN